MVLVMPELSIIAITSQWKYTFPSGLENDQLQDIIDDLFSLSSIFLIVYTRLLLLSLLLSLLRICGSPRGLWVPDADILDPTKSVPNTVTDRR